MKTKLLLSRVIMNIVAAIYRMLIGPPINTSIEEPNARLLSEWIRNRTPEYVHPQCTWMLDSNHPHDGLYRGNGFFNWYTDQLAQTYYNWQEVVESVIGSQIGGIVVGEYQFQHEPNGLWHTAPFTQFYRLENGLICSVRFYMGDVTVHLDPRRQQIEVASISTFLCLN